MQEVSGALTHLHKRSAMANELVKLEKFGSVYVFTLLGDGQHLLNEPIFEAIIDAMNTVQEADDAGALVTTNEGRFFSNGLDLNWVEKRRRQGSERSKDFKNGYSELLATVINLNVPTIAAICGHASAGGFIFALAHDHRCMRGDRGFLYMNEMDVRVRIPPSAMGVIRAALSPKAFKDTVLMARKQTAKEGYEAGIVDSVHEDAAKTLEAAISWAQQLSDRSWSREFYRNARLDMKPGLLTGLIADINAPSLLPSYPTLSSKL